MNYWREQNVEQRIVEILSEIRYIKPEHHFGRPFITAYQLAIEYARRYPDDVVQLGYQIGGEGIGERSSLAQYLARELSRRINNRQITCIEGAFLSNRRLSEVIFDNYGKPLTSSLTKTQFDLSMFRLRETIRSSKK
jgi:hypothetical protein